MEHLSKSFQGFKKTVKSLIGIQQKEEKSYLCIRCHFLTKTSDDITLKYCAKCGEVLPKDSDLNLKLKIVILGDAVVGKSALMHRFVDDTYTNHYQMTIGVDFMNKLSFNIGNNKFVDLQIWDVSGQERYRTLSTAFYHNTDVVFIIFDLTERKTFEHISFWHQEFIKVVKSKCPVLIIGNKMDCDDVVNLSTNLSTSLSTSLSTNLREVKFEEAQKFCLSHGYNYIEVSCKENINVQEAFVKAISLSIDHKKHEKISTKC